MRSSSCIEAVCEELKSAGVEPAVRTAGKHAAITWKHGDVERVYHTALSPSDHRSHKNARSDIRRMLREDGLIVIEEAADAGDRPRIFLQNGTCHCTSLDVAAHFGKQHKNVLRDIDRLLEDLGHEFGRLNFEPSSYANEQGKSQRCFNLSRDGFTLLAMGFTGASAIAWKVKYLDAFNAMERELLAASAHSPELLTRIEKLEGDLNALIDLSLSGPTPEPGYTIVKAHKRRVRSKA